MFHLLNLFLLATSCIAQQQNSLPVVLSPATINRTANNRAACPTDAELNAVRNNTEQEIRSLLENIVNPKLLSLYGPPCSCGGRGEWTRIAHLNMSDSSQQCPSTWRLVNSPGPFRGCGRLSNGQCDSARFSSNGRNYSRVCGRVIGYQKGSPSAFEKSILNSNINVNDDYLDGVSLTHGAAGSRQHIWSFAMALFENDPSYASWTQHNCFCTNTNFNWQHQTPSFVGNDYFCATGNPGPRWNNNRIYENPLWDGEGCISTDSCCQFNSPPWFCKTLPQPTTDDLELRICCNQHHTDEDTIINLVDIYVM